MKTILGDNVKDIKMSSRLTDSPCCLVADQNDPTARMQEMMKSMGQGSSEKVKPIMEINADHPLIKQLAPEHERLEEWSMVLFDQAALSEGARLSEPAAYVKRVNDLLARASLLTT